ncbi:MAG TPA: hypothetical protein VJO35_12515 [Terriglobales bacterium]|nr:hypothetical protein [Terriglobales bacterium]
MVRRVASWRCPEAWDQALFGLRLGTNPQSVITTTPRPSPIIKGLAKDPHTVVTRGTSYENRANLAPAFLDKIIVKYEGSRIGRQELLAEILEDCDPLSSRQTLHKSQRKEIGDSQMTGGTQEMELVDGGPRLMTINLRDIRTRIDVARYLQDTSPEWEHDVTNSWDAIAILLLSAAVIGTTAPCMLARFTGYDLGFICAVAWNMRNNGLWTATQYKMTWSPDVGVCDLSSFWDEVSVGSGSLWCEDAESKLSVDADMMPFEPRSVRGVI